MEIQEMLTSTTVCHFHSTFLFTHTERGIKVWKLKVYRAKVLLSNSTDLTNPIRREKVCGVLFQLYLETHSEVETPQLGLTCNTWEGRQRENSNKLQGCQYHLAPNCEIDLNTL